MHVAIVGATGSVGEVMLKVLAEQSFPISKLSLAATARSVGKKIKFGGDEIAVQSIDDVLAAKPDIALFSAGGDCSLEYAEKFATNGTTVIDNSSAFRMNENCKLVVPEINGDSLTLEDKIIPNPNCSTIQLVMCLAPLHKQYGLKRVIVSTYQSISGTGKKAIDQMDRERAGEQGEMAYPYPIDMNCLPHCDVFQENDYTKEEMKVVHETRKILGIPELGVSCTAVRIPVSGGHSESVNIEFDREFDIADVRKLLHDFPGIKVQDNPEMNTYPMPLYAKGKDDVFVGRLRRDESQPKTLNAWIVADNLRKGAATNAVQIALKVADLKKDSVLA